VNCSSTAMAKVWDLLMTSSDRGLHPKWPATAMMVE
jgi:hypothetical protein